MQNLQETQDKDFQEVKSLADEISACSKPEEFIAIFPKIKIFSEKVLVLKIYKEIQEQLEAQGVEKDHQERKVIDFEIDAKFLEPLAPTENTEIAATDISFEDEYAAEKNQEQEQLQEVVVAETEQEFLEKDLLKSEIESQNEVDRQQQARGKIVEIEKPERPQKPKEEILEEAPQERKFKLAHIKGITATVKSLFDDDPLESELEEAEEKPKPRNSDAEISADYLEAPKRKTDFKLDINDRLAFTKTLFNGSQIELNQMVSRLNSYETLEEAKQYLSDVYYERNWQEADEYAQRLWGLVEGKFL